MGHVIVRIPDPTGPHYWVAATVEAALADAKEMKLDVDRVTVDVLSTEQARRLNLALPDEAVESVERGLFPFLLSAPGNHLYRMLASSPPVR